MISQQIAVELKLKESQVGNVVELLDAGNTIPFIARYRKEMTGELDENVIRDIQDRLNYLRNLAQRKEEVLRIIEEQGKLTPELAEAIQKAKILQEVEDLYRPYKQKRRTRASVAKEKGLEPLAQLMAAQEVIQGRPEDYAKEYINPELGVNDEAEALAGAKDIIAEQISDEAEFRKYIRELTLREGLLVAKGGKPGEVTPYEMYYDYSEPVGKIPPHRILAINRGEKEEVLSVKIEAPVDKILSYLKGKVITNPKSIFSGQLEMAIEDAYKRLIAPSIEREVRNELTEKGETQAITVFGTNLKNLLLQPPVKGKTVLGIDPGYRTGCKLAVVDDTGKLKDVGVIYPHQPQKKWNEAKETIKKLVGVHKTDIIAIGNGTASRETEALVVELIKELESEIFYIIVSEAGASVYSASKVAGEEFPQYDLSLRSAISIARRLQDPLAELVKIEPKSIGVGQYQHDVNPKQLDETLGGVVESAVNSVGVDLNTASPSLLQYVAGIKPAVAKSIVAFREEKGKFKKRSELKKVPRLGEQTFIQCAGFLRIPDGDNPIEITPVHPESYDVAEAILAKVGYKKGDLKTDKLPAIREALGKLNLSQVAEELQAGLPTVKDIVAALQKPGRDPREDLPKPLLRSDITSLENLKEGMVLEGTVRNVVDFGAFVDIGVKQDGLVHISQITDRYIKHPMEVLAVGDIVKVKVVSVDLQRERIGLSMKI
ncbi:MAG: Tex family protein [Clostridia bacterium]|nr:Tex family protein [Clostridia bacterium]